MLLRGAAAPELRELREILGDIVEEDKRAGEVIRRLRELYGRGRRSARPSTSTPSFARWSSS